MIERRGASEIAAFDERDRQPALRGVVGNGQPVDTAAHDEYIEIAVGEPREVSNQAGTIL